MNSLTKMLQSSILTTMPQVLLLMHCDIYFKSKIQKENEFCILFVHTTRKTFSNKRNDSKWDINWEFWKDTERQSINNFFLTIILVDSSNKQLSVAVNALLLNSFKSKLDKVRDNHKYSMEMQLPLKPQNIKNTSDNNYD